MRTKAKQGGAVPHVIVQVLVQM